MSLSRTAENAFVPFHNAILEHVMSQVEIMNAEVSVWEIYFQMGPPEAFRIDYLTSGTLPCCYPWPYWKGPQLSFSSSYETSALNTCLTSRHLNKKADMFSPHMTVTILFYFPLLALK